MIRRLIDTRFQGIPVALVGDFNSPAGGEVHRLALEGSEDLGDPLFDTWIEAPSRFGPEGTFHGFRGNPGPGRIDWVLVNSGFRTLRAENLARKIEDHYPSDHCPVFADVRFEGGETAGVPHPEHPRPDLRRKDWVNLNGWWEFAPDSEEQGEEETWFKPGTDPPFTHQILVPFPWESRLSGVNLPEYRGAGWYRREVTIPREWSGKRVFLHFGAVDHEARVWVNGRELGGHVGGYTPFAVEIAPDLAPPGSIATVVVRAFDDSNPAHPTGKQVNWYNRTSGIWQTVFLEARSSSHITRFRVYPHPDRRTADIDVEIDRAGMSDTPRLTLVASVAGGPSVRLGGQVRGRTALFRGTLVFDRVRLWEPDDPHLYDLELTLSADGEEMDRITGYFGMRSVGLGRLPGSDHPVILLNGKPLYLRGALHQSFHPAGIYQYPDDAALRRDYEIAREVGLNFLRIHIKTEIPRALYWADRLGILIMADLPNFWRWEEEKLPLFESMLEEMIERDFNHPAIFSWCDFNETWGIGQGGGYGPDRQLWVQKIFRKTRALDPTRLVEDNSPCNYDHVETDINSWHFYINDYQQARNHIQGVVARTFPGSPFNYAEGWFQTDAPLINSEYGGISAGMGDRDISWCFHHLTGLLRAQPAVTGYIYTELSDIEWEHNGFVNYDRSPKQYGYQDWFAGFGLKDLNAADFLVIDQPPLVEQEPGTIWEVPIALSQFRRDRPVTDVELTWSLAGWDRFGRWREWSVGRRNETARAFEVVSLGSLPVPLPSEPGIAALRISVSAGDEPVAHNYSLVRIGGEPPLPTVEVTGRRSLALRFRPGEFSSIDWEGFSGSLPLPGEPGGGKFSAAGAGSVTYRMVIPEPVPATGIAGLTLLFEAGSRTPFERIDWPPVRRKGLYPQTDSRILGGACLLSINGEQVARLQLPGDRADARGALSHAADHHPGSHGGLFRVPIPLRPESPLLRALSDRRELAVSFTVPEEEGRGLALFGERQGRFPFPPTILVDYHRPHQLLADLPAPDSLIEGSRKVRVLLPSARNGGHPWRCTGEDPGPDWAAPGFDDTAWKVSRSGFGTRDTPGARVGTVWDSGRIWLRTTVELGETTPEALFLDLHHDEDVEVFIDGIAVHRAEGYLTRYQRVQAPSSILERLPEAGSWTVAVHCRQTGGGQYIDLGLITLGAKE